MVKITSLTVKSLHISLGDYVYDSNGDLWLVESINPKGDCLINGFFVSPNELLKVVRPICPEQVIAFSNKNHYYVERYKRAAEAENMLRRDLARCCGLAFDHDVWKQMLKKHSSLENLVNDVVKIN